MKEIEIYEAKDGKKPFVEWFYTLKNKTIQFQISERIKRIQLGNPGKYRNIPNGITELKFKTGQRIYYVDMQEKIILLLLGGNKTRQSKDIEKAQEYLQDYINNCIGANDND